MIDLETLGKQADSVILSIGAVPFGMDGTFICSDASFEEFPKIQTQMENRVTEWSTIKWWMDQDRDAIDIQLRNPRCKHLLECLTNLSEYCKKHLNPDFKVWANGTHFDISMLNHAYNQFGKETPWSYRNVRDVRTLVDLAGISVKGYESVGVKHSAVNDCRWQIRFTTDAYNIIKGY